MFSHHPTPGCVSVWIQHKSGRLEEAIPHPGPHPHVSLKISCFCTGIPLPPTFSKVLLQVWPAPPASPGNVFEMQLSAPDPQTR